MSILPESIFPTFPSILFYINNIIGQHLFLNIL